MFIGLNMQKFVVYFCLVAVYLCLFNSVGAKPEKSQSNSIVIQKMGNHLVKHGDIFSFKPLVTGNVNLCRKDLGHDDVEVNPATGEITWDTSKLGFGRGFYIRIKCSNYESFSYASMIVHVDKSGSSRLRIAGQNGVSKYISEAGNDMRSGDTVIIPDGIYPVSVSRDGSYENAFKMSAPTDGSKNQFSTVIAETPGGVTITGKATSKIGKQKNAIQLSETNYVAVVGFVIEDVQRESFTTVGPGHHLLVDFVGGAGAGTWKFPCGNFKQAKKGQCSNAGIRVNGGTPLIQSSYDWGHNRYGIMTRSTKGSITRRSFVRLDEHKGDQPFGGFSDYCDSAHLNQDNVVFDSLAIAAPHYKNYAGLAAFPATGCAKRDAEHRIEGLLSVNNKLSLSLMDAKAGPDNLWRNIVSYDSEGTCTPQKKRCGAWLIQSKKMARIENSYFGKARGFEGSETLRGAFSKKNINMADDVIIHDIPGMQDRGIAPKYLPLSQLYYNGRSDTFWGDEGYSTITDERRWPIPGQDIIARNMRKYLNDKALKVGGGTVLIDGNRGAVTTEHSMSEYFWAYTNPNIPPLIVRVNVTKQGKRIAWEQFEGITKERVTGWQVNCANPVNGQLKVIAKLDKHQLNYIDSTKCQAFAVQAIYEDGVSGIAYIEK